MTSGYLLKFALPLLGCLAALRAAQRRGLSLEDELGLRAPAVIHLARWGPLWMAWLGASEWLIVRLGLAQADAWPSMTAVAMAARVGALVISGPAAEELVTRGLALAVLTRRRWPSAMAVTVTAAVWAAAHYRYGWQTVALMTVDGLLLGGARVVSGSLWMPFAMHAVANGLSVMQSVGWLPK